MQLGQASLGKTDLKVDVRQGKGFSGATDDELFLFIFLSIAICQHFTQFVKKR